MLDALATISTETKPTGPVAKTNAQQEEIRRKQQPKTHRKSLFRREMRTK